MHIDLDVLNGSASIPSGVSEITIPADLSREIYLANIFLFLNENKAIKKIFICDDYLDPLDVKTKYFCKKLAEDLPGVELIWIQELKLDGRHGR